MFGSGRVYSSYLGEPIKHIQIIPCEDNYFLNEYQALILTASRSTTAKVEVGVTVWGLHKGTSSLSHQDPSKLLTTSTETKITTGFVNEIKVIPSKSHYAFLTGDSKGNAALFKIQETSEGLNLQRITQKKLHNGLITAIDIEMQNQQVATGGEDGIINLSHVDGMKQYERLGAVSLSIDTLKYISPRLIIESHGNTVGLYDLRVSNKKHVQVFRSYSNLSRDFIGSRRFWSLSVHPTQTHMCIAGDNQGCLSFWDTRKVISNKDNSDPILPYFFKKAHDDQIWQSQYVPQNPSNILTCGEDGKLLVWDLSQSSTLGSFPYSKSTDTTSVTCLLQTAVGINHFDIIDKTIIAATEGESLMFLYDELNH